MDDVKINCELLEPRCAPPPDHSARPGRKTPPNPELAAYMYPQLLGAARVFARAHQYAVMAHGSQIYDLDLCAVPWTSEASDRNVFVQELASILGCLDVSKEPTEKPHGRHVWTLTFGDHLHIDLSVLPPFDAFYQCPESGWVCFFCGEAFPDEKDAAVHFGEEMHCKPGCVEALTIRETGWLETIRAQEARIRDLQNELLATDERLGVRNWEDELERLFGKGSRSPSAAWMKHDETVGRMMAAEEIIVMVSEIQKELGGDNGFRFTAEDSTDQILNTLIDVDQSFGEFDQGMLRRAVLIARGRGI